jgi:hypothetical protein
MFTQSLSLSVYGGGEGKGGQGEICDFYGLGILNTGVVILENDLSCWVLISYKPGSIYRSLS